MNDSKAHIPDVYDSRQDQRRRKREGVMIIIILVAVAIMTFVETRIIQFGAEIPISNTILMFILINLNLLLLILLIFLVFRNLVKLLYERKRKVMGAKLRTRLVVAFIALTLLPTIVLFFFAINFITTSIEFWFNVPVELALENSLQVGQSVYEREEENNRFFLERVAYQIDRKKLLGDDKLKNLSRYIQIVQREFNITAVEVYSKSASRITFALAPDMEDRFFRVVPAEKLLDAAVPQNVWSTSEYVAQGELIRTIATVPYGVAASEADAFIILSTLIPPDLAQNMKSISRGIEEYQQIKLVKQPIQNTYYIVLSIVALLVLFCAIWFGFYLAKSISIPIKELAEGTRRVAEGDLGFTIDMVADDEIGSLVDSFNSMTRDLRVGREQLELSALMLQQQNAEIEERRLYMEIVLKNVSAGVITLDANGLVTTINTSAEHMLNLSADDILNKSYKNLLSRGKYMQLAKKIMNNLNSSQDDAVQLPLRLIVEGRPRSFLVHVNALKDDNGNPLGIVMVFDDLTELEKAQRMAAWREVARRIAHEVKNPLTPITLSAQRLKRKFAHSHEDDPVFEECFRMIIDHVDLIRNLVNEFATFARFPAADPKPCQLPQLIEETVALYEEGHENIEFATHITNHFPTLNLDRQQIKQALINLINNAVAAVKNKGRITIRLSHSPDSNKAHIEVADDGSGITDEDKSRLFEPNFSTKKAGMGLGLAIVSTIINDHQGVISVEDNSPRGARFIIELPVESLS